MIGRIWVISEITGECFNAFVSGKLKDLLPPENEDGVGRYTVEARIDAGPTPKGTKAGAECALELIQALRGELRARNLSDVFTNGALDQLEESLKIYEDDD